jgi:formylglycine-generating enzyme required for sulfatase activity
MLRRSTLMLLIGCLLHVNSFAVTIDWETVGDAGNAPYDGNGLGAVEYPFRISKFEITHRQYAEFLDAVASESDPYGLYNPNLGRDIEYSGIRQVGEPGNYSYELLERREERPMTWATFWRAIRFSNWMHNGQPTGPQGPDTTEDGAYTITEEGIANNTITRNPDAQIFIPSTDEWIKAAYYKGGGTDTGYWNFPYQSDEQTKASLPTDRPNTANISNFPAAGTVPVGLYTSSVGPYGTFDMGGNAWEWSDTISQVPPGFDWEPLRGRLGGGWLGDQPEVLSIDFKTKTGVTYIAVGVSGFRLASLIPEPGAHVLAIVAGLMLLSFRQ